MQPRPTAETPPCPAPAKRLPPLLVAVVAQVLALTLVLLLPGAMARLGLPLMGIALVQGVLAAGFGHLLRLPLWWLPINLLFLPATLLLLSRGVMPQWYSAAFAALALLFWTTFRTRVPLYLSSAQACARLLELVPEREAARVLDLGCGFGGLLLRGAHARPNASFVGVELAPLPILTAWWRLRGMRNARVTREDLWKHDLAQYDLVYAFLSPLVMQALWHKARTEMRPGSLLVSNSFAVEGVQPDAIIPLSGKDSRALYLWRL